MGEAMCDDEEGSETNQRDFWRLVNESDRGTQGLPNMYIAGEKRLFTDESVIVEALEDLLGGTLCTEKEEIRTETILRRKRMRLANRKLGRQ